MSDYTKALLSLRYSQRWMSFIEPMSLGLARRVLSVLAYVHCICPRSEPAGHYDGRTVTLTWHWGHCMLTIRIPPCHERVFDEPLPGEETEAITATFMNGATGEFWIDEITPGTGSMNPVFTPRVMSALLDLHHHTVSHPVQERSKVYISAFRFKRLFPDLPLSIDLEPPRDDMERRRFREKMKDFVGEFKPLVMEAAAAFGRAVVREAFHRWRHRHAENSASR